MWQRRFSRLGALFLLFVTETFLSKGSEPFIINVFLGQGHPRGGGGGEGAMRLTLYETPTHETRPDHNRPGTSCPTLCEKCVGSLTSPANLYREEVGDGSYRLPSISEKTRTSNHLQMLLQRRHILLSYFKTLSVGVVRSGA